MSNAINLTTGAYSSTQALVFVPQDIIDAQELEHAEYESDEGNEVPIVELGAKHGFVLDPFAPIFFSTVDHPKYGTINDVFASEGEMLTALEGLLDEGEEVDPEVGIVQHLIDEHGCVVHIEQFGDPRLKRVHQVAGWEHLGYLFPGEAVAPSTSPVDQGQDALEAISQALSVLERADLGALTPDVLDDIRKGVSALQNAEQSLTPQE